MKFFRVLFVIILCTVLIGGGGYIGWYFFTDNGMKNAPDFNVVVESYAEEAFKAPYSSVTTTDKGRIIRDIFFNAVSYNVKPGTRSDKLAFASIDYTSIDTDAFKSTMANSIAEYIYRQIDRKEFLSEIYDKDDKILPEYSEEGFTYAVAGLDPASVTKNGVLYSELAFDGVKWNFTQNNKFDSFFEEDFDAMAEDIIAAAEAMLPMEIRELSVKPKDQAPTPDEACYGSTDDPYVITELLKDPRAVRLMREQDPMPETVKTGEILKMSSANWRYTDRPLFLNDDYVYYYLDNEGNPIEYKSPITTYHSVPMAWNENIELLEGSVINYYLDESILVIQWQEEANGCCGTYSEVFVSDASQLRRKIAGDKFESYSHNYVTRMAEECNAVLAFNGDLYHHERACGIVVIDGKIERFEPDTCDTLYFDSEGNMLFSRRGEFTRKAQAQNLIDDNGISFSLAFGPILIDQGENQTPEEYPYGEINEGYARSAIGQISTRHYFLANLNCFYESPYTLATLQDMTNVMMDHGCVTAYALDGGQTAETVFNNELINPIQFSYERSVSDMIYFITAVPE